MRAGRCFCKTTTGNRGGKNRRAEAETEGQFREAEWRAVDARLRLRKAERSDRM